MGWGVQRCPCCDSTVSEALVQRACQASRPLKQAARAGWECVSYRGSACTVRARKQQIYLFLDARVCMHTQPRGQRAGAYINHKLSGSGSCTSNEMVQIKVCLWVVCVCVAALPLREQAEDQCQIWPPAVFLARPQGHFKHTHIHTNGVKSETFRYRH